MRVHVSIPGTVESYCVDERGEKRKASDELWLETYLCSVLRAYSYADDGSDDTIRRIVGVRRFNPVTNTETEHRFLHAAEQLFFRGMHVDAIELLELTLFRLAAGIRFRGPGPNKRLEPPDHGPPQIPPNDRSIRVWNQPVREASNAERRSIVPAGQGPVYG